MGIMNIFSHVDINEEIKKFNQDKDALLIDVRTGDEYARGHIEGSKNIPLDEIDTIEDVVRNKNTTIYVHCLSGGRSARATAYLKAKGYKDVHDIGGISSYRGKFVV